MANNSILLFGDYSTEVIRLSDLYDPEKAQYTPVPLGTPYISTNEYFKCIRPTGSHRYIEFEKLMTEEEIYEYTELIPDPSDPTKQIRVFKDQVYVLHDAAAGQSGTYVPVPQTLVVVDHPVKRWGTYTLLVVDRVDDQETDGHIPTYKSDLVPINFSGDIGDSSRILDLDNNTMMLFVEDVTVGGDIVQRFIPDRKLTMYGSKRMRYDIRKEIEGNLPIICTNGTSAGLSDKPEKIDYLSASGKNVSFTSIEIFKSYNGATVTFFDSELKQFVTTKIDLQKDESGALIIIPGSEMDILWQRLSKATAEGSETIVELDSQSALVNVKVPGVGYLVNGFTPLVSGEIVEFRAYEYLDSGEERMIYASKLTVQAGSSRSLDVTHGVITGFEVKHGSQTYPTDLWEIPAGTQPDKLELNPYLTMDDGSEEIIPVESGAFFSYGLEQLVDATVGAEFDIVFKFFPMHNTDVKSNATIDARYAKVVNTSVPPSEYRQYFTKDETGYHLAGDHGHITEFEEDVDYYTITEKLSWSAVATRPHGEVLVCRKRIRVKSTVVVDVHKVVMIPIWDKVANSWNYKFLAYTDQYTQPKFVSFDESDDGYVKFIGTRETEKLTKLPLFHDGTGDGTIYRFSLAYYEGIDATSPAGTSDVLMRLQNWTISHNDEIYNRNRWQFSWDPNTPDAAFTDQRYSGNGIPYGSDREYVEGVIRPFLYCQIITYPKGGVYGQYWVPQPTTDAQGNPNRDGFPFHPEDPDPATQSVFLNNFYLRALSANDTWARRTDSQGHTKLPTHFQVRNPENGVCSRRIALKTTYYDEETKTEKTNFIAYSDRFTCEGLPLPEAATTATPETMAIVVVEFLYKTDGEQYEHLLGVPVEVRRYVG